MAPCRLIRPYVGRSPTVPHAVLGETIDPSVSVPSENPTSPAAVADPDPADDPLDPRSYSPFSRAAAVGHGLFVRPRNQRSPCANAPIDSLPISTAPAWCSRSTHVASESGTRFSKGSAPQVVGIPLVSNRSFTPNGIPCSGPL